MEAPLAAIINRERRCPWLSVTRITAGCCGASSLHLGGVLTVSPLLLRWIHTQARFEQSLAKRRADSQTALLPDELWQARECTVTCMHMDGVAYAGDVPACEGRATAWPGPP